jgi:hypothetical protein
MNPAKSLQQLPGDLIGRILLYLSLYELGLVQCASHAMFQSVALAVPAMVLGVIPTWLSDEGCVPFDTAKEAEQQFYSAAYARNAQVFIDQADHALRLRMILFMIYCLRKFSDESRLLAYAVRLLDHFDVINMSPEDISLVPLAVLLVAFCMAFKKSAQEMYDEYIVKLISDGVGVIPPRVKVLIKRLQIQQIMHREVITMIPELFFSRMAQAAGVEPRTSVLDGAYTLEYSIFTFFLDAASVDIFISKFRPSLIAAAAVSCTLQVLGRREWSALLYNVTTYTLAHVAAASKLLMSQARKYSINDIFGQKYAKTQNPARESTNIRNVPNPFHPYWRSITHRSHEHLINQNCGKEENPLSSVDKQDRCVIPPNEEGEPWKSRTSLRLKSSSS